MDAVFPVLACFAVYAFGYLVYSRFLADKLFELRSSHLTPAHLYTDDCDYVPAPKPVLFGHHFASITGLSPMLGPAVAVIWGWGPAMLWVVFGAILIGCVHDFGALVLSVRARGMSIGVVAEGLIGKRGKSLLHAIIFFGVALAMGVFTYVIAVLFSPAFYPQAVLPSVVILVLAMMIGSLVREGWSLSLLTFVGFVIMLGAVFNADLMPAPDLPASTWMWILLAYAWAASVLPVWSLLQPRDFLNSLLLYVGLGAAYIGFFIARPAFVAPMIDRAPEGAPPILPMVFIVIACGAASGFHALVSSGTTAKQLDHETDARPIGYGAMVGESLLGLLAVIACTAGFSSEASWSQHYASWSQVQGLGQKMAGFIEGTTRFVTELGLPEEAARSLIAVMVVSFALTSLDSATRLLRYNIEEIGETIGARALGNRYIASTLAIIAIAFFAFFEVDGKPAGLVLWTLFGATNQLLAGLTLLLVTLYLIRRGKPSWPYLVPMVFMLIATLMAMAAQLRGFAAEGQTLLLAVGSAITLIALWLVVEAFLALRRYRNEPLTEDPEVRLAD